MTWFKKLFIGNSVTQQQEVTRQIKPNGELKIQPKEGAIGELRWQIQSDRITFRGLEGITSIQIQIPEDELVKFDAISCRLFEFANSCDTKLNVKLSKNSDDEISLALQHISKEQLIEVIMDIRAQRREAYGRAHEDLMERSLPVMLALALRGRDIPPIREPSSYLYSHAEFNMLPLSQTTVQKPTTKRGTLFTPEQEAVIRRDAWAARRYK
jgi:hypothetical protein